MMECWENHIVTSFSWHRCLRAFAAFDWTLGATALNLLDMSTEAPSVAQKVNLRRPDIMEAVQAQVLSHYRSDLVERIRAKGHVLSADGRLTIKLAKEFGFCYGV